MVQTSLYKRPKNVEFSSSENDDSEDDLSPRDLLKRRKNKVYLKRSYSDLSGLDNALLAEIFADLENLPKTILAMQKSGGINYENYFAKVLSNVDKIKAIQKTVKNDSETADVLLLVNEELSYFTETFNKFAVFPGACRSLIVWLKSDVFKLLLGKLNQDHLISRMESLIKQNRALETASASSFFDWKPRLAMNFRNSNKFKSYKKNTFKKD